MVELETPAHRQIANLVDLTDGPFGRAEANPGVESVLEDIDFCIHPHATGILEADSVALETPNSVGNAFQAGRSPQPNATNWLAFTSRSNTADLDKPSLTRWRLIEVEPRFCRGSPVAAFGRNVRVGTPGHPVPHRLRHRSPLQRHKASPGSTGQSGGPNRWRTRWVSADSVKNGAVLVRREPVVA